MIFITPIVFLLYTVCSLLLLMYGLNTCIVIVLFLRSRRAFLHPPAQSLDDTLPAAPEQWPIVTTQIPLFNEFNVAERVIRAVAGIAYPRERHEIQILDDSNDETCGLIDRIADELQAAGHWVSVFRRTDRTGYKAGALEKGMAACQGDYIAIFDSDFVPPPDFLKRTLPPLLRDDGCALVQARWAHLNQGDSWLTRAQAVGIDGHFVVEQTARNQNGLFMNFCGTAGVWRKAAIVDAGGWQHDTVTEDLDLSYRAQLKGWRLHYQPDVLVPAELPTSYSAFKSQQYRWAKGSMQTARKLLPRVWRAPLPLFTKWQATIHLTHYSLHFQMALLSLLVLPMMLCFMNADVPLYRSMVFMALLVPAALGPSIGYAVCQVYGHPDDWAKRILYLPFLLVIGFGICLSNAKAVMDGLFSNDHTFVRTPKAGQQTLKSYHVKRDALPRMEILLALYCTLTAAVLVMLGHLFMLPFVFIYIVGFGVVGISSLRECRVRSR